MTFRVLVVGAGVLADQAIRLLSADDAWEIIRQTHLSSDVPADLDLALVLDDAWQPATHFSAEQTFRALGIPWLRGFVALGTAMIGPLVRPNTAGCTQCADLRLWMADSDRPAMWKLRRELAARTEPDRDAWASRTGLLHVAHIVVAQMEQMLTDVASCQVVDSMMCTDLKTLHTARHFILPDAQCAICGSLPEDSPEGAVISLDPCPKSTPDSFRCTSLQDLEHRLAHDYLDFTSGLLNDKVHDLITPFAAVSVNLPLVMGDEGTSGRSHSYKECDPIAILEGLERFCGLEPRGKQPNISDSYANLKNDALDPMTVGLHSPEQYARPDFPFRPFDPAVEMEWVWGYSLTEQRPILIPQRLAYYSLGCRDGFVYETSNGCALGSNLVEAIFHGILELVERDAFLMTWYASLPLHRLDLATSTDTELNWMVHRLRRVAGYDLHVYDATMENGIPAIFVIAKKLKASGLNLLCSGGAHLDPMRALKGAIHETAGMLLRFDEKLERHKETYLNMLHDSALVRQMEDHSMLYGLPEAEERLSFLLDDSGAGHPLEQFTRRSVRRTDLTEDLLDMLGTFQRLNLEVIVVNQTSPEIARNGLHCVKVLIPGMLPMTFGHHMQRLEHLDRVLHVPMMLGYTSKPLTQADLNPHPHPFP